LQVHLNVTVRALNGSLNALQSLYALPQAQQWLPVKSAQFGKIGETANSTCAVAKLEDSGLGLPGKSQILASSATHAAA
jgi:hypothetical protein